MLYGRASGSSPLLARLAPADSIALCHSYSSLRCLLGWLPVHFHPALAHGGVMRSTFPPESPSRAGGPYAFLAQLAALGHARQMGEPGRSAAGPALPDSRFAPLPTQHGSGRCRSSGHRASLALSRNREIMNRPSRLATADSSSSPRLPLLLTVPWLHFSASNEALSPQYSTTPLP